MAQLVERLLPTSEIRDSNTVIGKIYRKLYWKDANKEKEAHLKKLKEQVPSCDGHDEFTTVSSSGLNN